jgi:hypothetical protein
MIKKNPIFLTVINLAQKTFFLLFETKNLFSAVRNKKQLLFATFVRLSTSFLARCLHMKFGGNFAPF